MRVLLSKLQTSGKETDEAIISNVKTLISQNEEEIETRNGRVKVKDENGVETIRTVAITGQENEIRRLQAENEILKEFLPDFLSADRIKEILQQHQAEINAAKNAGAATGVAIKLLKPHGAVEGQTVKDVVAAIYGQ